MPDHLVGSCTTFSEGMDAFLKRRPSIVICTQLLEDGSGLDLIREIKDSEPHVATLLFLKHNNFPIFQEAAKTHSDGIVLESSMGSGHAVEAIKRVACGGMYLEPVIAHSLIGTQERRVNTLTSRELEVMQLVVLGLNDREIGEELNIATDTVKYHLKQTYAKLRIHNRTRSAISLVLMGLVSPPSPLIPDPETQRTT